MLVALASLAGLIASATAGVEPQVSLICTGTQVSYRDDVTRRGVVQKITLPWSRTYQLKLKSKAFCEAGRCRPDAFLNEGDGTQLVFGDLEYGPGSTRLTYKGSDNTIYGHQVTTLSSKVAVHLETSGSCRLQTAAAAPTTAAAATPAIGAAPAAQATSVAPPI